MGNAFGSYVMLSTHSSGRKSATPQEVNVGGDQMNPEKNILPLVSTNSLIGGQMSG